MTANHRWIKTVSKKNQAHALPAMPWQRGNRRAEMIARREDRTKPAVANG